MVPSTDASKENTCKATFALMRCQSVSSNTNVVEVQGSGEPKSLTFQGGMCSPEPEFENNYSERPAFSIVSRRYKSTQTMPWNHGTGMGINITHVGPAGGTT